MKEKKLEENGDIKKDFPNQKSSVLKNISDKDADHKQAIWDMYAYYGEPSPYMFKKIKL